MYDWFMETGIRVVVIIAVAVITGTVTAVVIIRRRAQGIAPAR